MIIAPNFPRSHPLSREWSASGTSAGEGVGGEVDRGFQGFRAGGEVDHGL